MLEVEFKATLDGVPLQALKERMAAMGFLPKRRRRERDLYFNGVGRSFRDTDEALRLRSVAALPSGEEESLLTYKGPKLDKLSSARTELEVVLSSGRTAEKILRALGFVPVLLVEKDRVEHEAGSATICLDEVAGLGAFIELETLVEEDAGREAAEGRLLALLDEIGVPRANLTRESYLEMLLRRKPGQNPAV